MKTRIKHITMAFGRTFSVPPPGGGPKGGVRGSKKGGVQKWSFSGIQSYPSETKIHLSCHEYSTPRIWVKKKVCFIPKKSSLLLPTKYGRALAGPHELANLGIPSNSCPSCIGRGRCSHSRRPIPSVFGNGTSAWIPSVAGSDVLEQNIESCISSFLIT